MKEENLKSDEKWRKELDPEVFRVTRGSETEAPFSGKHYRTKCKGVYKCSNCKAKLFDSDAKFDSGTGWPSFYESVSKNAIEARLDKSREIERTEIRCARCEAHLGHVFNDGPEPTGERYCVNSAALDFEKNGSGEG